jgi:hypothetical protein
VTVGVGAAGHRSRGGGTGQRGVEIRFRHPIRMPEDLLSRTDPWTAESPRRPAALVRECLVMTYVIVAVGGGGTKVREPA